MTPTRRRWTIRKAANGHAVHINLITTTPAFSYGCTCHTTGPQRTTYAAALEDSQHHLDTLDQRKNTP